MILTVTMNLRLTRAMSRSPGNRRREPRDACQDRGRQGAQRLARARPAGRRRYGDGPSGRPCRSVSFRAHGCDKIPHRFTPIAGEARTCIALLHDGNQTELLESGPEISPEELDAFLSNYANLVAQADCVTISGSLPKGVPASTYAAW